MMLLFFNKAEKRLYTMNQKQLQSLSKKELIDRCNAQQLDTRGTKFDLVKRIMATTEDSIVQSIIHRRPVITIDKNVFNQYVHKDTLLVFDQTTQMVYGKKLQFDDETTHPLTYQDIQQCLRYKFRYKLPDNLADTLTTSTPSYYSKKSNDDGMLHKRLLELKKCEAIEDDEDEDEDDSEFIS